MASHNMRWNSLPLEMVRMIVDYLPRSDLFTARLLSKSFAAVAAVSGLSSLHDCFCNALQKRQV